MDTGCACARQRVNRCMTRTHTKVIIVLRVRGGGDHRLRERTSARRRPSCFVRHQPLNSILTLLYYYGRRRRSRHRADHLWNPTHTRRRFSLLFVYFSDRHRPAVAPPSLSTTTTTRYYYYNSTTIVTTTTTTTTTTSRIRFPMLP